LPKTKRLSKGSLFVLKPYRSLGKAGERIRTPDRLITKYKSKTLGAYAV
jgi:hypothetical protein